jgi:hypothetical protein
MCDRNILMFFFTEKISIVDSPALSEMYSLLRSKVVVDLALVKRELSII